MFDICTDVHLFQQSYVCAVAYSGHFCFGGDLTKLSITIASVDRFYLNFVICLQLDIALLIQNSVIIWHCLSELWQCIQGVTFFVDTVYNSLSSWICMSCVASWLDQKKLSKDIERVQKRCLELLFPAESLSKTGLERLDNRRDMITQSTFREIKNPNHPLHYLLPHVKVSHTAKWFCGLHTHINFHSPKLHVMEGILYHTAFPSYLSVCLSVYLNLNIMS